MHNIKKHIISSIAGLFTILQLVLSFFFNIEGIRALKYAGYTVWCLSIYFGWAPILILKRKGGCEKGKSYIHTTAVVDTGLYAIVRHPQYMALPLFNLALILISQHWLIITLGIPSIVLMFIDISKADQHNIEKFGDDYKKYMQKVPGMNFILGIIKAIQRKMQIKK